MSRLVHRSCRALSGASAVILGVTLVKDDARRSAGSRAEDGSTAGPSEIRTKIYLGIDCSRELSRRDVKTVDVFSVLKAIEGRFIA
ncbi:hypothetical protein BWO90_11525 (plasmid) [Sinorhizobium meliloti]|nr:hypothetical protein BWO90_11525 [Sinorhizobium meliloti]